MVGANRWTRPHHSWQSNCRRVQFHGPGAVLDRFVGESGPQVDTPQGIATRGQIGTGDPHHDKGHAQASADAKSEERSSTHRPYLVCHWLWITGKAKPHGEPKIGSYRVQRYGEGGSGAYVGLQDTRHVESLVRVAEHAAHLPVDRPHEVSRGGLLVLQELPEILLGAAGVPTARRAP